MENIKKRIVPFIGQCTKTIVCLALCVCMTFMVSYRKPAHAVATLSTAACVVIGLCASALGIGIAAAVSNEQVQQVFQGIADKAGSALLETAYTINDAGKQVVHVSGDLLKFVGDSLKSGWAASEQIKAWENMFPHGIHFFNPTINDTFIQNAFGWTSSNPMNTGLNDTNFSEVTLLGKFSLNGTYSYVPYTMFNGLVFWQEMYGGSGGNFVIKTKFDSAPTEWDYTIRWNTNLFDNCTVKGYILFQYLSKNGYKGYGILVPTWSSTALVYGTPAPISTEHPNTTAAGAFPIPNMEWYARGKSILSSGETTDSVIARLKERIGVLEANGTTTFPLVNTGSNTVIDNNTRTQDQTKTVGQEIATDAEKAASEAANAGKDTSIPRPDIPDLSLPLLIKSKFPFCLPWDIYNLVAGFYSADVKAPHWVWPIKLSRLGIDEKIDIDFSPLNTVAAIARFFEGAAFVFGLVLISRKMAGAGGD